MQKEFADMLSKLEQKKLLLEKKRQSFFFRIFAIRLNKLMLDFEIDDLKTEISAKKEYAVFLENEIKSYENELKN